MLRLSVLLLLLANTLYFAWAHELFAPLGFAPVQQSEPQRVLQQIRPEAVQLLPAGQAPRVETSKAAPAECMQAGTFTAAQSDELRQALQGWPAGSWALEPVAGPSRWIVYMGRYASEEDLNRKKAELRYRGVAFQPLSNAALEPGLSLGAFPTEERALQELEGLATRGVRTARVLQDRPETAGVSLRLAAVDDSLRPRLGAIKVALGGKPLQPCR